LVDELNNMARRRPDTPRPDNQDSLISLQDLVNAALVNLNNEPHSPSTVITWLTRRR
jgi:hypothetical protein